MYPYDFYTVEQNGLNRSRSPWLTEILDGLKSSDRWILTIIILGFYSVWSKTGIQDLQADPLGSKAVRIFSVLFAFVLVSRTLLSLNTISLFFGKAVFPIMLYLCVCALSIAVSDWPLLSAYKAFEIFIVIMLIVQAVANQRARPESLLRWMIGLIIVQIFVVWIEGLMLPHLAWKTPFFAKSVEVHMLRGVYPYINPNTVGFLGGVLLIYGICCLLGGNRWKMVPYMVSALGAITIIASYSRTSLFAASAALLFVLIAFRKIGVTIVLLVVLSLAIASGSIRTNIIKQIDRGRDSTNLNDFTSGRLEMWQESIENFSSSMLLGRGYGVAFRSGQVESNTNAHNSIIELYAGTGILGVFVWLFLMSNIWIRLVVLIRHKLGDLTYQHILAPGLMVYLFVFSLGNTRGVYLDYSMLLLACIAVYTEKTTRYMRTAQEQQQSMLGSQSLYVYGFLPLR